MKTLPWPRKPLLAIASLAVIIAAPQLIPQLYNWRVFEWSTVPNVLDFQPRKDSAAPEQEEMDRLRPDNARNQGPLSRLQDPSGNLDHFYAALARTESGSGSVTRILHYGDSPTTADMITADVRRMLQEQFGDAGHGTHLIAKPWAWYAHKGVEVAAEGWQIDPATQHAQRDGRYGLAGVSFIGQAGAWSEFSLRRPGHTRLTLSYLAVPGGGTVSIEAGGVHVADLETASEETLASEGSWPIPPEAQKIRIRVTRGPVRLFGVTLGKDGGGVMYDSLGLNGTWAGVLASYVNGKHWEEELRLAQPDLVVVNYGTNESGFKNYIETTYAKDMGEVLRRIRAAVPESSVLVMSPMDRGSRGAGGAIVTVAMMPQLVALQAKLAAENGCAFFDTFEAMGGPGTMGRWYMAEPRLVSADFIHPMPTGARIVGTLLYQALMDGFNRYKLKNMRTKIEAREAAGAKRN